MLNSYYVQNYRNFQQGAIEVVCHYYIQLKACKFLHHIGWASIRKFDLDHNISKGGIDCILESKFNEKMGWCNILVRCCLVIHA